MSKNDTTLAAADLGSMPRPDRVEERAYTPAVRGLSIQLMTFFRRPTKPRNNRVFRLLDGSWGHLAMKIDQASARRVING